MSNATATVFGFEYLEDAQLDQDDVVGCRSAIPVNTGGFGLPPIIICDLPGPGFPGTDMAVRF